MVHIRQIPLVRDPQSKKYRPRFLTSGDETRLAYCIADFESRIQAGEKDLEKEIVLDNFDDWKLGMCIYEVLSKWYPYTRPTGDQLGIMSQNRLKLWEVVNTNYNGAILDQQERKAVFAQAQALNEAKQNNTSSNINTFFFGDYFYLRRRIVPATTPQPRDLCNGVNLLIIKTLFRYAQQVKILIPKEVPSPLSSKQVKTLFYLSKRFGVFSSIKKLNGGGLVVEITGPVELIGRKEKYGRKIHWLFEQLLKSWKFSQDDWTITIQVIWGKGIRLIHFRISHIISTLVSGNDPGEAARGMDFDSNLEKQFYDILTSISPWEIEREPMIILEDEIFLPDFALRYRNLPPIYLEVAGFWTEDYKTKKIDKLTKLAQSSLNLIVIADTNLEFSKESFPFPILEYARSKLRPIRNYLSRLLQQTYLEPYHAKRIREIWKTFPGEIEACLQKSEFGGVIARMDLVSRLGLADVEKIHDLFTADRTRSYLSKRNWQYISLVGLIKTELLTFWSQKIRIRFQNRSRLKIDVIRQCFPSDLPKGMIPPILEHLGYKIKMIDLATQYVVNTPARKRTG
ncbi:MAG: DUF790 family protein [Candidatus Thorarchaeota archaeon]